MEKQQCHELGLGQLISPYHVHNLLVLLVWGYSMTLWSGDFVIRSPDFDHV